MVITAGANPDELDALAGTFDAAAGRITAIQRSLNPQINASPWHGRSAEQFRQRWSSEHLRAIRAAIAFLEHNSEGLRHNAQEQRNVSRDGGPGGGPRLSPKSANPDGTGERASSEDLDGLEGTLKALGLPADAIGLILDLLGKSKIVAGIFKEIADNKAFDTFIKGSKGFLDVGAMLVDFVTDIAEHAGEMPLDELLVHGLTETALRFAVDQGVDAAMDWGAKVVTPLVLGIVLPGVGAPIGAVVGPAVGFALKKTIGEAVKFGVDVIDGHVDAFDTLADGGVSGYRATKEQAERIGNTLEDLGDITHDLKEGAQNLAEDAGEVIGDVADGGKRFFGAIGRKLSGSD